MTLVFTVNRKGVPVINREVLASVGTVVCTTTSGTHYSGETGISVDGEIVVFSTMEQASLYANLRMPGSNTKKAAALVAKLQPSV